MRETVRNHYFVVGKLIGLILFMGYELVACGGNMMEKALLGLGMAFFLAAAVLYELTENMIGKIIEIVAEGILVAIGASLVPLVGSMLGIVWIADICVFLGTSGQG